MDNLHRFLYSMLNQYGSSFYGIPKNNIFCVNSSYIIYTLLLLFYLNFFANLNKRKHPFGVC